MPKHDKAQKGAWPVTLMKMERQGDTLKTERRNEAMKKNVLSMNLQHFAEPGNTPTGGEPPAGKQGNGESAAGGQENQQPAVDYDKIQKMLEGALSAKENTALKAYFREQGLSQEEMEQAISAFKAEQARKTPDINAMQTELTNAKEMVQRANIEKEAMFMAGELGIDLNTMPYVLKLAELDEVTGKDGAVDKEALKKALNHVLEELPQLKPDKEDKPSGFRQIGGSGQQGNPNADEQLATIFGNKK